MQYEVAPIQLGLDVASGEIGAQVGTPHVPRGHAAQELVRKPERGLHERIVSAQRDESQDVVLSEVMVAIEQRLEREPGLEIGARENERERLPGRHKVA